MESNLEVRLRENGIGNKFIERSNIWIIFRCICRGNLSELCPKVFGRIYVN